MKIIKSDRIYELMTEAGWIKDRKKLAIPGILDRSFVLPPDEEVWKEIKEDVTDLRTYSEKFDCDNFTFKLLDRFNDGRGWATGALFVQIAEGGHAIFFYINDREELKPIEPQSDMIFGQPFLVFGVVMFNGIM